MNDKPWLTEPDEHLFESHGYVCHAVRRQQLGFWCGYIYIPMAHPYAGLWHDAVGLDVHGGLTYAEKEGESWCFGFDCGHYDDWSPKLDKVFADGNYASGQATYKTLDFVINELDSLAKQLKEREQ